MIHCWGRPILVSASASARLSLASTIALAPRFLHIDDGRGSLLLLSDNEEGLSSAKKCVRIPLQHLTQRFRRRHLAVRVNIELEEAVQSRKSSRYGLKRASR